jgi:hypothetical protein
MRYMALKNNVADHWFPRQDLRKQAKLDEFINWQHQSVRKPCVELFIAKVCILFDMFLLQFISLYVDNRITLEDL